MAPLGSQVLSIGALSQESRCNIETIRYYERIGVMPEPPRTEGGHRQYREDHLKRLTFVRRARELGFSLHEVRELLGLVDGGVVSCGEVKALTLDHLGDVRRKLRDLRAMERVLKRMASECDGGTVPDCPIIEALFKQTPASSRRDRGGRRDQPG